MASEAQRRANDKWREKFDEIRFRVPKGQKAWIQNHAIAQGESVNAFVNRAIQSLKTLIPYTLPPRLYGISVFTE